MDSKRIENAKKFRSFFSGSGGEFALEQINGLCGYDGSTFDEDPYVHAYKAGQRSVAVAIHALIEEKEHEM